MKNCPRAHTHSLSKQATFAFIWQTRCLPPLWLLRLNRRNLWLRGNICLFIASEMFINKLPSIVVRPGVGSGSQSPLVFIFHGQVGYPRKLRFPYCHLWLGTGAEKPWWWWHAHMQSGGKLDRKEGRDRGRVLAFYDLRSVSTKFITKLFY